ncbi:MULTISPECIES: transporter substrate-binding domain-containing protein [unclassified Streptomyces]|uniref:caspase, EACC1-associated type n=1 Tax=unclassified Streptomyces TaxID=2593676 RepID=UPI0003A79513|nr:MULTISPECIES: transporter substrate-binding domain-containing protein [unclassified Streptomyces]MYY01424.1 transporter substrate-binding domain-containing protein [Streptomyces sp. SID4913]
MTSLSAPGSRVLLIGTGSHNAASGLPSVPAVMGNLADLGQVLVERCGLAEENLRVIRDPANPMELGIAIAQEAERAEGVLWIYYVGHGLVSPTGELHLATVATDSRSERVAYTALAYAAVRGSLLKTAARSMVVVLDCCFSGRAVGVLGDAEQETGLTRVDGGYVLAAAARDERALFTPGAPHTAFTGELIRLLSEGDPEGSQQLTLREACGYLERTLPARGFPRPRHLASERIEDLVLCPNPAYRPPPLSPVLPALARVNATPQPCPYPGLAAFDLSKAQWFFGREQLITELAGRLARRMDLADPLVLMGPSGSGKSSLLGAGLLTALGKGAIPVPGSRTWPHLLITPTEHPLTELANRLERLTGVPGALLRKEIESDPLRLVAVIREMLKARAGQTAITGSRLVLVVDQFEEIFTQCADVHERQMFISALCAAASGGGEPPALVVLGLRSDFHDRCAAYPELQPALRKTPLFVGPMTTEELREAITRPAQIAGLELQSELANILLRDLGADGTARSIDPEALPLLSHTLRATWQNREGHTLTMAGYAATGYVRNSVGNTAEAVYGQFNFTEQQTCRSLLLHLIHIGEGTQDTRRRVNRIRLLHDSTHPGTASEVLEVLAGTQLVTVEAGTVEITHEVLLHAWPRLRQWIEDDRSGLRIHQQLAQDSDAWERNGRNPAQLYRGSRLGLAREWVNSSTRGSHPSPLQRKFVNASVQAVQRRKRVMGLPAVALCSALLVMAGWLATSGVGSETGVDSGVEYEDWKVSHPSLRVGVMADQPGMSTYDEKKNEWTGYDIDMARAIAMRMGYAIDEVVFSPVTTENRSNVLRDGRVDLVLTEDRKLASPDGSSITFAGPYYQANGAFLVRKDSSKYEINDSSDLQNQNIPVCIERGSTHEKMLTEQGFTVMKPQPSTPQGCLEDLLNKNTNVYAMTSDDVFLARYANEYSEVRMLDDGRYGVAMRSGTPSLRREVCLALLHILKGKAWDEMYRANLSDLRGGKPPPAKPGVLECKDR